MLTPVMPRDRTFKRITDRDGFALPVREHDDAMRLEYRADSLSNEVKPNEPFRTIAGVAARPSVLEMVPTIETIPAVETVEGCSQTPLVHPKGLEPPTFF